MKKEISYQRLNKKLINLFDMILKLLSVHPPEVIYGKILETAVKSLKAEAGSLMLFDEAKQKLKVVAYAGKNKQKIIGQEIGMGERVAGRVAKREKPLLIQGDLKDNSRFKKVKSFHKIQSAISTPLRIGKKFMGVLNLNILKGKKRFTEEDLEFCTLLGHNLSLVCNFFNFYYEYSQTLEKLRNYQVKLFHNEKIAVLGKLSSGMAHEIRNPLGIISLKIQSLLEKEEKPERKQELQDVLEECFRISRLIERILTFSRQGKEKLGIVSLPFVINKAVDMARYHKKFSSKVQLTVTINKDVESIEGLEDWLIEIFS